MGTRYTLEVTCRCGHVEKDVYYAPTCGITTWTCPPCGEVIDLEQLTGITSEMASNRDEIETVIRHFEKGGEG